jgi:hypothetical protein
MSKKLKTAAPLVEKPLALRLWEFGASLKVVRDALEGLRVGKSHQLLALAGQLRMLLTDRSKGVTPLLIEIAKELDFPLKLYHGKGARSAEEAAAEGPDPLLFLLTGFPISLHRESQDQVEADLQSLLKLNIMRFNGVAYTTADLIDFFANYAGGAHSPPRWSRDLSALLFSIQINGGPAPATALIQLAKAVLKIGAELLREIGMIELHLAVALPNQRPEREATLLHMAYSVAPASLAIYLDQLRRIRVQMTSMHGTQAQLSSNRAIDLPSALHIGFVQTITDDLETEMVLMFNGDEVAHVRTPELVMLPADRPGYTLVVNRSPAAENWNVRLDLGAPLH